MRSRRRGPRLAAGAAGKARGRPRNRHHGRAHRRRRVRRTDRPDESFRLRRHAAEPPSPAYLLGTDDLGRDLLAGVVHGARTSLLVARGDWAGRAIGVAVGAVSGWRGGVVDDVLMRVTEFVQVVPRFFLAVMVIALFGPGRRSSDRAARLDVVAVIARVVRADVLSLRTASSSRRPARSGRAARASSRARSSRGPAGRCRGGLGQRGQA